MLLCLIIVLLCFGYNIGDGTKPCDSQIYCDGPILHAVQMARIFQDSKTFVDMSLNESPKTVMTAFNNLSNPSKDTLQRFVKQYFSGPGEELENWEPTDFVKLPSFLNDIKDPLLKDFGWNLCRIWKDLGRKVKDDVMLHPDQYSMIYLPKPFIVPGGRFRETFYWDSYWVIKGLLICEMNTTVKGMLENFVHYVKTFGFVPNGGRIYFTRRSQPPLLIQMMYEYYKATGDLQFIRENLEVMETEYQFWQSNRTVSIDKNGKTYKLNQYRSEVIKPRPESYYEDIKTVSRIADGDRPKLYSNLISACESGWDFSSRWFSSPANNKTLESTSTMDIVPVDLNSILYQNEEILKIFHQLLGNTQNASFYQQKISDRREAIETVLYNKNTGLWNDYSLKTKSSRAHFYMSNIFPVYMKASTVTPEHGDRIQNYIKNNNILEYKGGVPTSMYKTGQQWDFPNAWSPLEHIMIWSLETIPQTRGMAFDLAKEWILSNYKGWNRTRGMFEKYNVLTPGSRGGGGEYDIQEGFGWTNGVALEILKTYGNRITVKPESEYCTNSSRKRKLSLLIFSFCFAFLAVAF